MQWKTRREERREEKRGRGERALEMQDTREFTERETNVSAEEEHDDEDDDD